MKLLAFVDTHGDEESLKKVIQKAKLADIVICAGDLTIFESNIDKFLKQLNNIGKPVLIIPGNHESSSVLTLEIQKYTNIYSIHKSHFVKDNFIIFGWGGGGFSLDEPVFDKTASSFLDAWKSLEKKTGKKHKLILVTHAPPYATKLDDLGEHVGCKNITNFIKHFQPILAISGHIHETFGVKEKIDKSLAVNPGPEGMMFEF